jgi:predicted nuclease with TOPRIM domain
MTNPIVQTDLAEILKEIKSEQKAMFEEMRSGQKEILKEVSDLKKEVNNIQISQAKLEEKFESQKTIVTGLKSSQDKQIWALIILAFTAVVSLVIGLGKFIFFPNP